MHMTPLVLAAKQVSQRLVSMQTHEVPQRRITRGTMRDVDDFIPANRLTREKLITILDEVSPKTVEASKFLANTSFATDKEIREIYEALLDEAEVDHAKLTYSSKQHKITYES